MNKAISCCACAAAAVSQLGASPVQAAAASQEPGPQASIAFADLGGIRNWRADGNGALLVQSRRGQWYRAELLGACFGLPTASEIGFVFEASGSFDRFSSIVVDGRQCRITSLVETEGPAAPGKPPQDSAPPQASTAEELGADLSTEGARIPFANLGGIENWRAVDDDTLYIEGRNDQWYHAELRGHCPGMRFETSIGFVTRPIGGFDEFSSIMVDGRECFLESLSESPPPPAG